MHFNCRQGELLRKDCDSVREEEHVRGDRRRTGRGDSGQESELSLLADLESQRYSGTSYGSGHGILMKKFSRTK